MKKLYLSVSYVLMAGSVFASGLMIEGRNAPSEQFLIESIPVQEAPVSLSSLIENGTATPHLNFETREISYTDSSDTVIRTIKLKWSKDDMKTLSREGDRCKVTSFYAYNLDGVKHTTSTTESFVIQTREELICNPNLLQEKLTRKEFYERKDASGDITKQTISENDRQRKNAHYVSGTKNPQKKDGIDGVILDGQFRFSESRLRGCNCSRP